MIMMYGVVQVGSAEVAVLEIMAAAVVVVVIPVVVVGIPPHTPPVVVVVLTPSTHSQTTAQSTPVPAL